MEDQSKFINKMDWSYLVVLDACRADSFEKYNDIVGEYQRVRTCAGDTIAWNRRTFPGKYDITLYSGSPWLSNKWNIGGYFAGEHFKKVIDIWDSGWDNKINTTPPEAVYNAAKNALPRSIIWFEQPHFPAISEKDRDIWAIENKGRVESGMYLTNMLFQGRISEQRIRDAHFNNVEAVMPWVKKLVKILPGKVIVTADHGEMLGEFYAPGKIGWFHGDTIFGDARPPELWNVPLLVLD